MLSMALQEAMTTLRRQERAMAARAEASEQLADQIVEGLTSGLVVVSREGVVQAINPAARRILELGRAVPASRFARRSARRRRSLIDRGSPARHRPDRAPDAHAQWRKAAPPGVTVSTSPAAMDRWSGGVPVHRSHRGDTIGKQLRLKEALARLGELTAGLAHEFRNGLATIHGYGKLLDPDTCRRRRRRASKASAQKRRRSVKSSPTSCVSRVPSDWRWPPSISERRSRGRLTIRPARRPRCGSKETSRSSTVTRCC